MLKRIGLFAVIAFLNACSGSDSDGGATANGAPGASGTTGPGATGSGGSGGESGSGASGGNASAGSGGGTGGAPVLASPYFVLSPRGSDDNPGTIDLPWKDLYVSLEKLQPGDTLYLRGGDYTFATENEITIAGTVDAPITITAYPGETPIFTGTSVQSIFMFFRGDAAYLDVGGMTVYGEPSPPDSVVHGGAVFQYTENANHITVRDTTLYGSADWANTEHFFYVGAGTVNGLTIENNVMDGKGSMGAGYHSYHDPNGTEIVVHKNTMKNLDQCVMIWSDTSDLTMTDNVLDQCRIGVRYNHSNGTTLTGNTATNFTEAAIQRDSTENLVESNNSWN